MGRNLGGTATRAPVRYIKAKAEQTEVVLSYILRIVIGLRGSPFFSSWSAQGALSQGRGELGRY